MAKANKIGKTEEFIAGYRDSECLSRIQRQSPSN